MIAAFVRGEAAQVSRDSHVPVGYGLALSRRRENAGALSSALARFSDHSRRRRASGNGRDNSRADNGNFTTPLDFVSQR